MNSCYQILKNAQSKTNYEILEIFIKANFAKKKNRNSGKKIQMFSLEGVTLVEQFESTKSLFTSCDTIIPHKCQLCANSMIQTITE